MRIYEVPDKKKHIDLLLLADEQESMIEKYLAEGTMYVLEDDGIKAECVVTDEGNGVLEVKNLAVLPQAQRKGYGKKLIEYLAEHYAADFAFIQVGTGDSPLTIPFYEHCGFVRYGVRRNFFLDNYDHAIFEGGRQLIDMVVLRRKIGCQ